MTSPNVPVSPELQLGDQWYRFAPISARTQLHIMRRIAPLSGMTVLSGGSLMHMARVLADMREEDVDYVLDACLRTITRRSGDSWAPITTSKGTSAFDDIGPVEQFKLTQHAIRIFQTPFFEMLADVMTSPNDSGSITELQAST